MAIRYDRAPLKATKTPEGFLHDSPVLSRVGVFEYRQPDGTIRREFRPPEEVFHADHLASLNLKPITDEHHGMITGANVRSKLIGSSVAPAAKTATISSVTGDLRGETVKSKRTEPDIFAERKNPGEYQGHDTTRSA